jgi:DNA end-binding protein Ku
MAGQLIKDMTTAFDPRKFEDKFSDAIHALIARKVKAGEAKAVEPLEEAPAQESNVIELSELLRNSLGKRRGAAAGAQRKPAATRKPAAPRKRA